MIRRDTATAGNETRYWLLISQVDHAHLAFRLAEHWGGDGVAPLVAADELLYAIKHHDDGWSEWEQSPDIEPESLAPRSFTEMEVTDALAIWTGSIVAAARGGPLAGYVVAGHFSALARRFGAADNDSDRRAVARFLTVQDELMARSLAAWRDIDPATHTRDQARLALAQLQFFDLLSLWLCCDEATEPDRVETPRGPELTLTPASADEVQIAPWPFTTTELELAVPARRVARRIYRTRDELAAAPSQSVQLHWTLRAGGP